MASDILEALIRVNIVAAVAVLAVLLLRRPLRALAGPRIAYGLWLLVPLAAAASFLPAPAMAPAAQPVALPTMRFSWGEAAAGPVFDLQAFAVIVWAQGLVVSVVALAMIQRRSVRRLGRLAPAGEPRTVTAERAGFGPAVVGGVFPRIVLPADFETRFTPRERSVILAHEACHLRRLDPQVNTLIVLSQCICWFNPLVHMAAFLIRMDQELACDAAVLARYPEARRSYAEAMLKTQLAPAPLPLGCYWPARSEHPLKERLAMLKLAPPGRLRRLTGATAIALAATAAAYSAWAAKPADAPALPSPVDRPAAQPPAAAPLSAPPAQPPSGPAAEPSIRPQEVCLTNACTEAVAAAPTGAGAAGTVTAQPGSFDARFNAKAPVMIRGTVTGVSRKSANLELTVRSDDGKLWRVVGGSPERMPPEFDAGVMNQTLIVRGYQSWDESCAGGCEMNGRDITFMDARKVFLGDAGTGSPQDGTGPSGQ